MPTLQLPYGRGHLDLTLPDGLHVEVIAPRPAPPAEDPQRLAARALAAPVGGVRLADFAGARSAAIAISDKTRPFPLPVLRALLDALADLGLPPEAITLLIGTGTHTPMPPEEFPAVVPPDLLARHPVYSHDCDAPDLVALGVTSRGTPVTANRRYMAADLRLVVGNIEPHQFMGFSGGVKGAAIGLAGRETINRNHALLLDPRADLARYDDNPMRQEVEEIGRMMGVHFVVNAVLDRAKQAAHVLAGDPVAVMRAGIPLVRALYEFEVEAPFDVVITAPGGHPKDINLYQAQKALGHAIRITREGGTAILVAACPEGTGSAGYEAWIAGMRDHHAVLERFAREPFRLGPHKAFQLARDAVRARLLLVSEMPPDFVRGLLLTPATLPEAVALALHDAPPGARIAVLPVANATIPTLAAPQTVHND